MPKTPKTEYDNSGQAFSADIDSILGRDNELEEEKQKELTGEEEEPKKT